VSRLGRKTPVIVAKIRRRENFISLRNNDADASVESCGGVSRFHTQLSKGYFIMTNRNRFSLGIFAAAVSLGLAFAPAAFAQDKMGKDDSMKKDTMSKDTMSKDSMKKDSMSKDKMSKDNMKKDDSMKK
jgi:pentapeptide MXKDX repeat protein